MELQGKVALITGAAHGIGEEIAKTFAAEGASVALCDLDEEGVKKTLKDITDGGGTGFAKKMDVADEEDVRSLFEVVIERFGTLDILVNNAGMCRNVPIEDIESDEWDRYVKVNLKSVFLCSKQAIKIMRLKRYGRIISMGSAAGKLGGVVAGAHYSAAKAGVMCFTKSLALQNASYGINANAIAPGPVATAMTDAWGDELNRTFREKIPLKKYGTPNDVAQVALFLASDRSQYLTGEIIDVNGGLLMD
jgi:3-oxoacyl-[acyl-carrier protein] reductase